MTNKLARVYRYALFLVDRFKYLILLALVTFVVSTWVLWLFHPQQHDPATRRSLGEVAFGVFELMFASEPALPYPKGNLPSQFIFFLLPILNILGLAAAFAQFSQILFDRGLYNRAQAENADGHVILCGLGRLGREVLRQLDQRHGMKDRRDIVIVESGHGADALDSEYLRRDPIIPVLHGSMTDPATLKDAGIARAVAICMLTGEDTTNLEAALLARELNCNVRVVLRMSNKRVTQRLDEMLRGSLIRNFHLIDSVEGSAPKCVEHVPNADGEPACSLLLSFADPANAAGHVVICGLGRLGFGIVRMLKGRLPIVVVDRGERLHYADEPVITSDPAVTIIRGDMRDKRVMQQARVDRAAAVLIMTPDDTQNLEAAMLVHELNPSVQTLMRISNSRISQRLDRVLRDAFGGTLRVIDPSVHAAPHFVDAVSEAYAQEPGAARAKPAPHPILDRFAKAQRAAVEPIKESGT
jgi:Trk K+ transport system NAD-binding subunit